MTRIILVGEAYGAREDMFQHALVGASGAELARMLHQAELGPEPAEHPSELMMISYWKKMREQYDIDITNVFNVRPAENKIELFFTNAKEGVTDIPPLKPGKYVKPEMLCHVHALWQFLLDAKPNLVVAMGNTASWALLGQGGIGAIRGTVKISSRLDLKILPTYHPAAVLRQWNLRTIVMSDLEKAREEAKFAHVERIKRWVTVEPTLDEIREWLTRDAEYYAVDIETAMSSQISMIGFARSPWDAIVVPFLDKNKPDWNFWPTVREEILAWDLVDKLLRKQVPKVFQNGIFDLSYLLRAGLRPTMCQDDSMLLHHALYPEMLKGLGFLGSIYSSELSWKQMRTKGDNLKRDE